MDPPVVVNCTVCELGAGGETKLSELTLSVRSGNGAVTMSDTFAVPGAGAASDAKTTCPV